MVIKAPEGDERGRVRAPRAAAEHRPVARRRPAPDRHRASRRPARPGRLALYRRLCEATGQRQDPCVLDTFMAATDFMRGAPAAPWWKYTAERKATFGAV